MTNVRLHGSHKYHARWEAAAHSMSRGVVETRRCQMTQHSNMYILITQYTKSLDPDAMRDALSYMLAELARIPIYIYLLAHVKWTKYLLALQRHIR